MTRRSRVRAYGAAAALVLAGVVSMIAIGGTAGEALFLGLGALGAGAALLLVFYEIGLSEDRQLAREGHGRRGRSKSRPS